jgi:hypothetical protein
MFTTQSTHTHTIEIINATIGNTPNRQTKEKFTEKPFQLLEVAGNRFWKSLEITPQPLDDDPQENRHLCSPEIGSGSQLLWFLDQPTSLGSTSLWFFSFLLRQTLRVEIGDAGGERERESISKKVLIDEQWISNIAYSLFMY